jgi:FkbM family methyltransferase
MAGRAAGDGLEEFIRFPSLNGTLLSLKRRGFTAKVAIDIGAFRGEWSTEFKAVFPDCRVIMIEAQSDKVQQLRVLEQKSAGSISVVEALLGAIDGDEVEFHVAENASSVFRERGFASTVSTRRKLSKLDTVLETTNDRGKIDFLKLDTQGFELEVLRGAPEALARSEFVLLEVSLIPINEGCPMAREVLEFMAERGFRWIDVCGQWRRPDKALWQLDLLFLHESSAFMPSPCLEGPTSPD